MNMEITALKTKVDSLTKQVQETAQLKTEIASLQTKLSAAEQQAQRVRDEYNALIRIKAVAESLPVPESTVH
jgi:FtsZ-binding cell division protein ZapB